MSERQQSAVDEITKELKRKGERRQADNELDYARDRFKKTIKRLFEYEIARIEKLIEKPNRYSVREWEKVRTDLEWIARRFMNLVERMEEVRPLTKIDDTSKAEAEGEDAVPAKSHGKGGRRKLIESQVSQIKSLVNAGELGLEEIAARFDISPAEVSGIKNERFWDWVEPRIRDRLNRYETKINKIERRF